VLANFFPYHHLTDAPFDEALEDLLPAFWEADSALAYHRAVAALAVRLQDTHARAVSDVLAVHVGRFVPPLEVRFVEGRPTVVAVLDDLLDVEPGDVLVGIDGRTVEERCDELLPLLSHSTPQARDLNLGWMLLLGAEGSTVDLRIRGASGSERHVRLGRTTRGARDVRSTPIYGMLASGHGYIDLARLEPDQVGAAFDALAGTAALIFDVRGRTRDTMEAIAVHLSSEPIGTANVERLERGVPGPGDASRLAFVSMSRPPDVPRYAGRVVALIDARTISQAESTCLVLESATAGTAVFVGAPTNGANGDLTCVELPGEVALYFSGQSVRHRDGRELQRAGIQPHIHVAPTLEGVRAGRDEVLERALRFLETGE
jgi:C-terminal processing protease CtpA/Prc